MHRLFIGLLGAAALGGATMAQAQITISSITPGTNPYSGPTPTYDFDTNTPVTVGGMVTTGTNGNFSAQPYGSTGNYYVVGPYDGTPGTIDLSGWGNIYNISLLWGSVDTYNTLQFLGADDSTVLATFTGSAILPATGSRTNPITNPIVTFSLAGSDVSNFSYLRLSSQFNAFEIDNIAINRAVPEPATWGMMLLGFGAIGFAVRRNRRKDTLAQLA